MIATNATTWTIRGNDLLGILAISFSIRHLGHNLSNMSTWIVPVRVLGSFQLSASLAAVTRVSDAFVIVIFFMVIIDNIGGRHHKISLVGQLVSQIEDR